MKLSELRKVLKQYQKMYGDIEIDVHYKEYDTDLPLEFVSLSQITEEDKPFDIKKISIWV